MLSEFSDSERSHLCVSGPYGPTEREKSPVKIRPVI